MRSLRSLHVLGAVLCTFLYLTPGAYAQEATLVGTVTDSTDAVLPGVTVTALRVDSGNTFVAVTDEAGQYRIPLRVGLYRVTAELPGFTSAVRENVELLVGQRVVFDLKLGVSTVQEAVTVTADAPLVDVTQSRLSGNIDSRQVQELPLNGRNFLDLSMLAPGSRANSVAESPLERQPGGGGHQAINVDGTEVTQTVASAGFGQPRFSKDAIAEFEMITNRFDATMGNATTVMVNVVTKSGTNRYAGSVSGFFRDDKFNAADKVVNRVLPYSDQQISTTFGGPIIKDRFHFFANYEYERNPQTYVFTTPYPSFNREDLTGAESLYTTGLKLDGQLGTQTHLMVRGFRYSHDQPYDPRACGGGDKTISVCNSVFRTSDSLTASVVHTFGTQTVNEVKASYNSFVFGGTPLVQAPRINLLGFTMGQSTTYPIDIPEIRYVARNDLTTLFSARGRHELKTGLEYFHNTTNLFWANFREGLLVANRGPVPANIEQLFPDQRNFATWNMAALSPITTSWRQSFGNYYFDDPYYIVSTWVQDNWAITPRLTANLGLRWEVAPGALAEDKVVQPWVPTTREAAKDNFAPRLGGVYSLNDGRTAIRGGWGKFFGRPPDTPNYSMSINQHTAVPSVLNDGRANFAADPYNGRPPTVAEAFATVRDTPNFGMVALDIELPYSYQSSIGFQHQLATSMSVQADYVYQGGRAEVITRNQNLTYDPVTGINYPFTDISRRVDRSWGLVDTQYSEGISNYHGLQTAFTKRFSNRWQATATYTLSQLKDMNPCPGGGEVCPKDLGNDYTLAVGDQRHRAVFNGIWSLPYQVQVSGLYFYGSGLRYATSFGGDRRLEGRVISGRLAADGSIVPRNNFTGKPIHRVDVRLLKSLTVGRVKADGIIEVFNLFNHANFGSYVTTTSLANYGRPVQNTAVAYQPRIMQLGFRVNF